MFNYSPINIEYKMALIPRGITILMPEQGRLSKQNQCSLQWFSEEVVEEGGGLLTLVLCEVSQKCPFFSVIGTRLGNL